MVPRCQYFCGGPQVVPVTQHIVANGGVLDAESSVRFRKIYDPTKRSKVLTYHYVRFCGNLKVSGSHLGNDFKAEFLP